MTPTHTEYTGTNTVKIKIYYRTYPDFRLISPSAGEHKNINKFDKQGTSTQSMISKTSLKASNDVQFARSKDSMNIAKAT